MKAEMKYWNDTKNVDLVLTPENSNEEAMLGILRDRTPRWAEVSNKGQEEIIFEPVANG